jgi:hypothetical protein
MRMRRGDGHPEGRLQGREGRPLPLQELQEARRLPCVAGRPSLCPVLTLRAVASFVVAIPDADVVVKGTPAVYVQPTSTSGTRCERHFCGACGTHVLGTSGARPGLKFVKATLFDIPPPVALDVFMEDAYGGSRERLREDCPLTEPLHRVGEQDCPRSFRRQAAARSASEQGHSTLPGQ